MKKNMFKKIGILSISAVFALGAKNVAAMEPEKSAKSAETKSLTVIEPEKSHQAAFGFSFDKMHQSMAVDNLKISENLQRFMSKANTQKRIDSQVSLQEAQAQEVQAQNVADTVILDSLCGLQILHDTEQESMSQDSKIEKIFDKTTHMINTIDQMTIASNVNKVGSKYAEVAVQTDMLNIAKLQNVQLLRDTEQESMGQDSKIEKLMCQTTHAMNTLDQMIMASNVNKVGSKYTVNKVGSKYTEVAVQTDMLNIAELQNVQQIYEANQKLNEELDEAKQKLDAERKKAQQCEDENLILAAELDESKQENETLKEQIKSLKKRDDQELKLQNDFQPAMRNFAAPVALAAAPYERIAFQEDDRQNSVLHEIEIQDGPVDRMNNFSAANAMSYANFEKAGNKTVPNFDTGNKLLESQNDVQDKLVATTIPVAQRQVTANDRGVNDEKTSNLVKSIFGLLSVGK